MELRQLIAFKEVATHASFTAAATHLHLTQSAVSQQIKALEDECNVTLFDRSGRLVRLTNAGQVLLSHVERILAQVDNARIEMAEMAGGARGRCRLASLPTIAAYLLPRALATFQRRYPGVEVQLMEAVQLQLLEWVQQGTVDFSIVALPVHDPHLQSAPLLHDDFVLVVPKDHAFAARRIVKLAELVTERFILYPRGRADVSNLWKPVAKWDSNPRSPLKARIVRPSWGSSQPGLASPCYRVSLRIIPVLMVQSWSILSNRVCVVRSGWCGGVTATCRNLHGI